MRERRRSAAELRPLILTAHKSGDARELARLQAEFRTSGGMIERGSPTLKPRLVEPTRSTSNDVGTDLPFGHSAYEAVLRDEFAPGFTVDITINARKAIEAELARVRRDAGREVEAGGWLFANHRPRDWSDSIAVVAATWAGEGARSAKNSMRLGDVYDARAGLPEHLVRVGDYHTHPASEPLPSDQDVRSWAATADRLGRSHYLGVIVTPSGEGSGWTIPSFDAWIVKREGAPSRPICSRARLAW